MTSLTQTLYKPYMIQADKPHTGGFSLVEVVIALGIAVFCLVPVMALLGVASKEGEMAEEQTDIALILQSQTSILEAENFDVLTSQVEQTGTAPLSPIYYYAAGGQYLGQTPPATQTRVFYRCTVQQTASQLGAVSDDRLCANLLIQYPAPGYSKKRVFPLSFFRYGPR